MHCNKHWDMSCDKRQYIERAQQIKIVTFTYFSLPSYSQGKATDKNQDQTEAKQLQ